jgi:processing peptidase subunit beta
VTNFIHKLRFRGTSTRSRADIEKEVNLLGGQFHQEIDKERNSLYVTVQKDHVKQAFALVGDLINNSTFNDNQIEAERENVYRSIIDVQKDMLETTLENSIYTSFRDHQLGQPTLGTRDNVGSINAETIKKFVAANHHANNFAVVATGPVNHTQITELTQQHFGGLVSSEAPLANTHQAMYTPSLMYIRDDEMANLSAGVFLPAPSISHPDSHVMKFFVALLGNYRADKHTATNLNDPSRQYNYLHEHLGNLPDISLQQTFYLPYSDTGLIGSYVLGNELFGPQIVMITQQVLSNYALEVSPASPDFPSRSLQSPSQALQPAPQQNLLRPHQPRDRH